MPEYCRNCSSELFEGQRFCRACGAPTDPLPQEQATTRMMPPQPDEWGARRQANTAPSASQDTSPVWAPAEYQPTAPMYPQVMPPYTPPQKRTPIGWILAFIGMGLFIAVVIAAMLIARMGRPFINGRFPPPGPPPPPLVDENALDSSADQTTVSGSDTTMIKTFPLLPSSKFSIKNISGSIAIEAWDQPKAEVTVIKRGSDNAGRVYFKNIANSLSFRTAVTGGNNQKEFRYQVKLPKSMGSIDLESANGTVKLTNLNGQIFVETANGNIELNDVVGVSKIQSTNGKITGTLGQASSGPMEFSVVNGRIDLTVKSDFNADLEASAVTGSIRLDDQFGIQVEKQFVGSHASGKIGSGGQPLKVTSVNGPIRIARQ